MPTLQDGIGLEQVIDEIIFAIAEGINDKIDELQPIWDARDSARATRLGIPIVNHLVEHVLPENIVTGDIPSLVQEDLPTTHYPNVCVIPDTTQPDPEDPSIDQYDVLQNAVDIHALVKADSTEGANYTYWRAVRTAEALDLLISSDRKLSAKLRGVSNPQIVQQSPPFDWEPGGHGEKWWWRAARIRYLIKSYKQPSF